MGRASEAHRRAHSRPNLGRSPSQAFSTMDDLYGNWAQVYDLFYPDRSTEVDFWAGTAERLGGRVLDLMCGTAEVSLGLARRGFRVVGVDVSPAMLLAGIERQAAAADYPAQNLSLAQGDALCLPAPDGAFDFALIGGSGSFNHLDKDQASAGLAELRRVLRPGGGLGLELVNPYLLQEVYPQPTMGPLRPPAPGTWVERICHNHFDPGTGLLHIHQWTRFVLDGENGEFEEEFYLQAWTPDQIQAMLHAAGFGDVRFCGDYELAPFDPWSADLLVTATSSPPAKSLPSQLTPA